MRLPPSDYQGPNARGFFLYNCPYCADDGWPIDENYHFGWNPTTGRYNCVRCGARGPAPKMARPYGTPVAQGWTFAESTPAESDPAAPGAIPGYCPLGDASVQSRALVAYLTGRGLPVREIRRRRLGYSTDPFFAFAVMVPFFSREAKVEFYQARFTRHRPPRGGKYWTAPAWEGWPPKSQVLYGMRWLSDDGVPTLVEGVFDAMAAPNGLAYLGSSVTLAQARIVAKLSDRVVLAPDGGLTKANRCVQRSMYNLSEAGVKVDVCELPKGMDPAKLGLEEMTRLCHYAHGMDKVERGNGRRNG